MDPPGHVLRHNKKGRPPASRTGLASHDRKARGDPNRHPRQTHMRRADRMTPLNRHASSARIAPNRNEPDTALTALYPTRPVALSIGSLRLHWRMFHRRRLNIMRGAADIAKRPLDGSEQGPDSDSTSLRPTHLALPNACDRSQKSPPVAIGPGAPPATAFNTAPSPGRRRRGAENQTH
jgi:hypothetical protein